MGNCEEQLPSADCRSSVGQKSADRFFWGTVLHFYRQVITHQINRNKEHFGYLFYFPMFYFPDLGDESLLAGLVAGKECCARASRRL